MVWHIIIGCSHVPVLMGGPTVSGVQEEIFLEGEEVKKKEEVPILT